MGLCCVSILIFVAGAVVAENDDIEKMLAELKRLAETNPLLEYGMGLRYLEGKDVPQDYARAAEWFRKAAEQGVAVAQCKLIWVSCTPRV